LNRATKSNTNIRSRKLKQRYIYSQLHKKMQNNPNQSSISHNILNPEELIDPVAWMADHCPNVRKLDVNWTMERYDYPAEVRDWIMSSPDWRLVSTDNGGTYERVVQVEASVITPETIPPEHSSISIAIEAPPPVAPPPLTPLQIPNDDDEAYETIDIRTPIPPIAAQEVPVETSQSREEQSKAFAKDYQETQLAAAMDAANKKALDVWADQGITAAVAHMFKRPESEGGGTLSYSEMRSRYG